MAAQQRLVYLNDFTHWYDHLTHRAASVSYQMINELRTEVRNVLRDHADVTSIPLEDIRAATRNIEGFLVTLDGGTYFNNYDYSFAMTRAVTRIRDVIGGHSIRIAREGSGQFWTQVDVLRELYDRNTIAGMLDDSPIIICDDGIDSGDSLKELIRQLRDQYLSAASIRVVLNPRGHCEIDGVPVHAIYEDRDFLWTHERDFFWGSPGGGVSLCDKRNINSLSGVPYSLSSGLLKHRIGFEADVSELRRRLLEINLAFWQTLSDAAGRVLRVRDVPRLAWALEIGSEITLKTPIVDVIRPLIEHDPDVTAL